MRVRAVLMALCIGCVVLGEPVKSEDRGPYPEEVVRQFYSFLLSNEPPEKGPALFLDPSLFLTGRITRGDERADTARLWAWFRARKAAVGFRGLTSAGEFGNYGLRRIFTVDRRDHTSRLVGVTVFAKLFPQGRDGIWKEVFFPLESRGGRTLINPVAITVNGILLDPRGEWSRKDPLYESLGLR